MCSGCSRQRSLELLFIPYTHICHKGNLEALRGREKAGVRLGVQDLIRKRKSCTHPQSEVSLQTWERKRALFQQHEVILFCYVIGRRNNKPFVPVISRGRGSNRTFVIYGNSDTIRLSRKDFKAPSARRVSLLRL